MVKLTRTLSIIPTVIIFSLINNRIKRKEVFKSESHKLSITSILPYFILGFLIMVGLNSAGVFRPEMSDLLKNVSKFLMIASLAAIGLNTKFNEMKKSGINPMIHGFVISVLVVIVAISVEYFMGLV